MAIINLKKIIDTVFGNEPMLSINADNIAPADTGTGGIIQLNLSTYSPASVTERKTDQAKKTDTKEKSLQLYGDQTTAATVIDLGRNGQISAQLERKPDIALLRNYSRNSVWVRAALDYCRRMVGRAKFELIPQDSTKNLSRRDKQTKAAVESVLNNPNAAHTPYTEMKEQMIEDYYVIGHGVLELDLLRDLTVSGVRTIDAALIGFVKEWDGTVLMPRYVEFDKKNLSRVKRYLAHEQLMCLVNRPCSYSKLGFSHVEALHRTVMALLSGDDYLIRQILQPVASALIDLGENATKQQVDEFKHGVLQVREALAVIGGSKNTQVHRLAATSEEMKILDGQQWFVRQVAAVFGISTAKLKLAVDTSRANTESMFDDDLESITGDLTRVEELENATFIKRYLYQGDINLQFFYPIMHRKDEKQQAVVASMQTRQPWATLNEARARTGEKALDENEFPLANEVLINHPKFGPLPLSTYAKFIEDFEKNIGSQPPVPQPAAGEDPPAPQSGDVETGEE